MGRPSKYVDREKVKSTWFQCILYPSSQSYDCNSVLEKIKHVSVNFAYILHNRDVIDANDVVDSQDGEYVLADSQIGNGKKEHFHCVFLLDNAKQLGLVANLIGLKSNYLQKVESKSGSIQYLVHKNNPEKAQYDLNEVVTNIKDIRKKYFADDDCIMKASKILDFITSYDGPVSITSVATWCIDAMCWDEFRRGQHLFSAIINEHNLYYKRG